MHVFKKEIQIIKNNRFTVYTGDLTHNNTHKNYL